MAEKPNPEIPLEQPTELPYSEHELIEFLLDRILERGELVSGQLLRNCFTQWHLVNTIVDKPENQVRPQDTELLRLMASRYVDHPAYRVEWNQ